MQCRNIAGSASAALTDAKEVFFAKFIAAYRPPPTPANYVCEFFNNFEQQQTFLDASLRINLDKFLFQGNFIFFLVQQLDLKCHCKLVIN